MASSRVTASIGRTVLSENTGKSPLAAQFTTDCAAHAGTAPLSEKADSRIAPAIDEAMQKLNLDIQGAASRDDTDMTGFLKFVGIVCLVILVPLTIYLVVNNLRRMMARNRRRRRRVERRRSR